MAIGTQREATTGSNQEKMKTLQIADLLVPGLFLIILVMLTIFVYVPSIKEASTMRNEIDEVKTKQSTLQGNLDVIKPFVENPAQLQKDLNKTEQIIPQKLDVADFSYYVDKLAQDAGLTFKEITQQSSSKSSTSETKAASTNENLAAYVKGVSGPIVYEGTYSQIVEFLDQLQKESPYIVEARQLDLEASSLQVDASTVAGDSNWRIELSIMGYYIEQESEVTIASVYQKIIPYTQYPSLLEIFDYKNDIINRTK